MKNYTLIILITFGIFFSLLFNLNISTAYGNEEGKQLRVRDFRPKSNLHLPITIIKQARYSVIDFHSHVNDLYPGWGGRDIPITELLNTMDKANVKTLVILTGKWGEALQVMIDKMVTPYPNRFIIFTELDWTRVDEPDFAQQMVINLQDAVKRGAKGLNIKKRFWLSSSLCRWPLDKN